MMLFIYATKLSQYHFSKQQYTAMPFKPCDAFHWIAAKIEILSSLDIMNRQTLLPSLLSICLVSRLVYLILVLNTISAKIFFPLGEMIGMVHLQKRYSFCETSPGRLAVFIQVVQKERNCLVSCPHQSQTFDAFTYLSVKCVTVFWQFVTFWVQSFCASKEGHFKKEMWHSHLEFYF